MKTDNEENLRQLQRTLGNAQGASLLIVTFDHVAARKHWIRQIDGEQTSLIVDLRTLKPAFEALEQAVNIDAGKYAWIHLIGWEKWALDEVTCLKTFNQRREQFFASASTPVILWLPEPNMRRFTREAPDVWALRMGHCILNHDGEAAGSSQETILLPFYEQFNDIRSRAYTITKVVDSLEKLDRHEEALRVQLEEELPLYEQIGDKLGKASVMVNIANTLEKLGNIDQALRIFREKIVPAFNQTSDTRVRAAALDRIATMLKDRGELDEALRIWQEEVIPVYDKSGDEDLRAIAIGRVADILEHNGEVDEALRIRREEEMPVYEKNGNIDRLALVRMKLATQMLSKSTAIGEEQKQKNQPEHREVQQQILDQSMQIFSEGLSSIILSKNTDFNREDILNIMQDKGLKNFMVPHEVDPDKPKEP